MRLIDSDDLLKQYDTKNVIVRHMSINMNTGCRPYMNIEVDVNLTNLPKSFTLDHVEDVINRAFNPIIFGKSLTIKKVIYNGPATIILWDDGTKTVVKCKEGDPYSPEAGFALAVLKRLTDDGFHKCLRKAMKEAVKLETVHEYRGRKAYLCR